MPIVNINLDEESQFQPITPGWYKAAAISFEKKVSQSNQEYLQIIFQIISHQGKGRKVRDNFNLWHSDPDTRSFSVDKFKLFATSCGASGVLQNTDVLMRKPVGVRLFISEWNERRVNNIAEYCLAGEITKRDGAIATSETSNPVSEDLDDTIPF